MITVFYALHVLICLFLIMVVLLQQGKGADLSVFGGGGTMTAFGARGAATVLHKLTVGSFIAFIITTMAIGILEGRRENASVMSGVAEEAAVDPDAQVDPDQAAEEAVEGALIEEDEAGEAGADEATSTTGDDSADEAAPADEPEGSAEGEGDS